MLMTKKKPGRPKSGVTPTVPLHVEIDPRLKKVIEESAEENDRKITGEVNSILKAHYTREGRWPPPEEEDE